MSIKYACMRNVINNDDITEYILNMTLRKRLNNQTKSMMLRKFIQLFFNDNAFIYINCSMICQ